MYEPVLHAKPDTNFCASELHLGHIAALSASPKGRFNSNCALHLLQRYSYIGMLSPPNPQAGLSLLVTGVLGNLAVALADLLWGAFSWRAL